MSLLTIHPCNGLRLRGLRFALEARVSIHDIGNRVQAICCFSVKRVSQILNRSQSQQIFRWTTWCWNILPIWLSFVLLLKIIMFRNFLRLMPNSMCIYRKLLLRIHYGVNSVHWNNIMWSISICRFPNTAFLFYYNIFIL